MLKTADLEAAVTAGVVTRENADALLEFARTRRALPPCLGMREDERFRFLKGFNDVFLTTGVVLIALAAATLSSHWLMSALVAAAMWVLSEILVRREKAVLPGIALSIAFAFFAILAATQLPLIRAFAASSFTPQLKATFQLCLTATAIIASGLYYYRFRFPFALLLVAAATAAAVLSALIAYMRIDLTHATAFVALGKQLHIAALLCGLATFAIAMRFDMSDPDRLTRRADCGFWLHLAAAPMIVHPAIVLLDATGKASSTGNALVVLSVVFVLAIVAIVIDRRALLVSSLFYLITALTYLLNSNLRGHSERFAIPLVLVGLFVLVLGLYWRPLRSKILAPFKDNPILKRLPPLHA